MLFGSAEEVFEKTHVLSPSLMAWQAMLIVHDFVL
jgi:hypothetical protein